MTYIQKIFVIAIIITGMVISAITIIQIYFPSPAKEQISGQVKPNPDTKSRDDFVPAIERIILTSLNARSISEARGKFDLLSQKEKNEFVERFFTKLDIETIKGLLGKNKGGIGLKTLPAEHQNFLAQIFAEMSGLPPNMILHSGNFDKLLVMLGFAEQVIPKPEIILFNTIDIPQDNRRVFKPSDSQIYACFSSQGGFAGLRYIKIKWTNLTSGKIIYNGYKLIDPTKSYNFVWVRNYHNWEVARYEVSISNLCDNCLARGDYEIK